LLAPVELFAPTLEVLLFVVETAFRLLGLGPDLPGLRLGCGPDPDRLLLGLQQLLLSRALSLGLGPADVGLSLAHLGAAAACDEEVGEREAAHGEDHRDGNQYKNQ
jgi:hypothetical protein